MSTLTRLADAVRFIGLLPTARTVRYALRRDLLEQRWPPPAPPAEFCAPQPAAALQQTAAGRFEVAFGGRSLEIAFLTADMLRLTWRPGLLPVPYAIARSDWPPVDTAVETHSGGWILRSAALSLHVEASGAVSLHSASGACLRREAPPRFGGAHVRHTASLRPEERIYGLGESPAPWARNQPGLRLRLWNLDPGGRYAPGQPEIYLNIPVYLGLHKDGSYLVFYENSFQGEVSFSEEQVTAAFSGGALRYYLIAGKPPTLLTRYTELTGRPPMPPLWALGYHQSRWGYRDETDIRRVAEGFIRHDIPISAIHMDIDYMDGYRVFTVHPQRFPDLPGLAHDLREQGIRLVTILDPGVKADPQYTLARSGLAEGRFCREPNGRPHLALVWPGWCYFPDFTSPATRRWWGSFYTRLLDQGISGFWHDMNEPAAFAAWGEPTLPRCLRHDFEGRGGDHREAHNLYALLMNRAGFEAQRRYTPQRRPWQLSRSGWAGVQRYAWHWTGDVESSWAALRRTISMLLNLSLSGVYYSGSDIGGFSGHPDPELYLRWFQMAAFTPFFRLHSATGLPEREPWRFDQATRERVRTVIRLRYRLLPYWYTLAWLAASEGAPLLRPVWWEDGETNPDLWAVDDAFLVGGTLLAAPVTQAGGRTRSVLLPPGGWYDFWEDTLYPRPGPEPVAAPLERIPLFVRAGSVLPMRSEQHPDRLELHLYAPPPGDERPRTTRLYTDAGDGYGPFRVETFTVQRRGETIHLTQRHQGGYPAAETTFHFHGCEQTQLHVEA